jgi:DNA-directed RNA polymerase specialized sigma24 family protein
MGTISPNARQSSAASEIAGSERVRQRQGPPCTRARGSQDRSGSGARDHLHNADEKTVGAHTSGLRVALCPPASLASPICLARLLRSAHHHAVRLGADVVLPLHVLYAVTLAVAEKTGSADPERESLLLPTLSLRTLEELHAEFGHVRPSPQPLAATALSFSDEVEKVVVRAKRRAGKDKSVTLQHVLAALVWMHDPLIDRALLTVWCSPGFQAEREALARVVERARPLAVDAGRRWNMISDVDEILSDLYLKLANRLLSRSVAASDLEQQPRSYFRTIIENSLRDHTRRQAKTLLCDPLDNLWMRFANEIPNPDTLGAALRLERQETELERALDRLTAQERDFIRAVYAPRESGVTAISRGTEGSRFASGFYYRDWILKKLRRCFG